MKVAAFLEIAKMAHLYGGNYMHTVSAEDANQRLGLLLDRSRAEPVEVEKYGGRAVVVTGEESGRLSLASANSVANAKLH